MLYWIAGPVAPAGGAGKPGRNQSTTGSGTMTPPTRRRNMPAAPPRPRPGSPPGGHRARARTLTAQAAGSSGLGLRTKGRRAGAKAAGGLGILVVDYLKLIRTGEHEENRVQELATITRNLKSLARELDVTIVALSQLVHNAAPIWSGREQLRAPIIRSARLHLAHEPDDLGELRRIGSVEPAAVGPTVH